MKNPNESKEEKFVRLAEARTNKIAKELELLGNLANTSNYSYTDAQVKKIFDFIEKELEKSKKAFNSKNKKKNKTFQLTRR